MNFACELMDLCRGTQEVEAVLSEGCVKSGSRDPLARLKMAVEYEEKKVLVQSLCCLIKFFVTVLELHFHQFSPPWAIFQALYNNVVFITI